MSLHAVSWLSSKLGINIDGRTDADESTGTTSSTFPSSNRLLGAASKFDLCLNKINDAVFGRDADASCGGGTTFIGGGRAGDDEGGLDENGLPLTKNWYYYDTALGRWNVSPEAPASIRQEYERRLREEEDEREGRNVVPPPPPPPPPAMNPPSTSPPSAVGERHGAHPQRLFGAQSLTGQPQHRPQYAMPTYFELSTSSMPHSAAQSSTSIQQPQQHQEGSQNQVQQPPHFHEAQVQQNYYAHPYQQQSEYTQFVQHQQQQGQQYQHQQQQPPQPQVLPPPPTMGYGTGEQNHSFQPSIHNSMSGYSVRRSS